MFVHSRVLLRSIRNPSTFLMGVNTSAATIEISMEISQKVKARNSFWSRCPLFWNLPKELKVPYLSDTYILMFIAVQLIVAQSWRRPVCPSTEGWVKNTSLLFKGQLQKLLSRNFTHVGWRVHFFNSFFWRSMWLRGGVQVPAGAWGPGFES